MSLPQSWSDTAIVIDRLWNDDTIDPGSFDPSEIRPEAAIGYGFAMLGGRGALTPNRSFSLGSDHELGYRWASA